MKEDLIAFCLFLFLLFHSAKCRQTPQFPLPRSNERKPGCASRVRDVLTEYVCTLDFMFEGSGEHPGSLMPQHANTSFLDRE